MARRSGNEKHLANLRKDEERLAKKLETEGHKYADKIAPVSAQLNEIRDAIAVFAREEREALEDSIGQAVPLEASGR